MRNVFRHPRIKQKSVRKRIQTYRVITKSKPLIFLITLTLSNNDRFSRFFAGTLNSKFEIPTTTQTRRTLPATTGKNPPSSGCRDVTVDVYIKHLKRTFDH